MVEHKPLDKDIMNGHDNMMIDDDLSSSLGRILDLDYLVGVCGDGGKTRYLAGDYHTNF